MTVTKTDDYLPNPATFEITEVKNTNRVWRHVDHTASQDAGRARNSCNLWHWSKNVNLLMYYTLTHTLRFIASSAHPFLNSPHLHYYLLFSIISNFNSTLLGDLAKLNSNSKRTFARHWKSKYKAWGKGPWCIRILLKIIWWCKTKEHRPHFHFHFISRKN